MVINQSSFIYISSSVVRVPVRSGWVAQRGSLTRPTRVVGLSRVGWVLGGLWPPKPGVRLGRQVFAKPNFYWLEIKIRVIIFLSIRR